MRIKEKRLTYTFEYNRGSNRFDTRTYSGEYLGLCAGQAKATFDLAGVNVVDFVITNAKPKGSLANWQILTKQAGDEWVVSSTPTTTWLLHQIKAELIREFPKNKTLYVSAYA